jgi:homoserine O-acetyltransferase
LKGLKLNNCNRGFSQTFYRKRLYETYMGYKDLEDFLANWWETWSCSKGTSTFLCVETEGAHLSHIDPDNLLVMAQTWQNGDVSKQEPYNGNFELAMASIKAKTLVMPCDHDLYFP